MFTLRPAHADDVQAITDITNQAIVHTTAIWTLNPVTAHARGAWMHDRLARGMPVIIAETDGQVVGFGSYGDFRPHEGYRHTVEHSVYVRGEARGRGLGKALTLALIDRARRAGKHVMVAAIDADNSASISLHERLGFTHAGRLDQVGTKFGRWLDVIFLQLILDAGGPGDAGRS